MTETAPQDIVLSIKIEAPIDRVWYDMTATERVPLWLGCLHYRKQLGQIFYMQQDADKRSEGDVTGATHCEILDMEEPHTFRFSWFFPDMPKTFVTITLTKEAERLTDVKFVHSGWEQFSGDAIRNIRDALSGGWKSFVLPNLKTLCEN